MRKILIVSAILPLLLLTHNIMAERNSLEFEFARDFIESVGYLLMAAERHKEEADYIDPHYSNEVEMVVAIMRNFRLANKDTQMAKSQIEKYLNTESKLIKETAEFALLVYDKEIELNNKALKLYEELYSPEIANNPEQFNQGKFMSEASEISADREAVEKTLFTNSILVTHILVSDIPDKEGRMSYLAITSEEKKQLNGILERIFGDEVRKGMQAGQTYLEACGTTIFQVLNEPGRKTADER